MDLDLLNMVLQFAIAPVGAYFFYVYKKQTSRIEELDKRVASIETSTAVIKVVVENIKDDIREIRHGIEKLVDRQ